MSIIRFLFRSLMLALATVLLFFVVCNIWVVMSSADQVYQSLEELPAADVGLVLGTSKRFADGSPNLYFERRMDAAYRLYNSGKVKRLILSGDNRTIYYNEPGDMRKALIKRGVPSKAMTLDSAGLRTLDSVVRSKEIFNQQDVVVVTQRFHAYRAIFIGNHRGMNIMAYAADPVPLYIAINTIFREYLARTMAVIDLYILNTSPGENLSLEYDISDED